MNAGRTCNKSPLPRRNDLISLSCFAFLLAGLKNLLCSKRHTERRVKQLREILTVLGINKCKMRGKDMEKRETYESEILRRAKYNKMSSKTEVKN